MPYDTVLYETAEKIATITLNRPERMNAWNATMAEELSNALREAAADDDVRAIIITGAGRGFCAGADLQGGSSTFSGRDETGAREGRNADNVHPYDIPKPVIAAINGAAVGVGMTYPMTCDVRIAAEEAKLGFVFVRRGMMPELAAHVIVQRVVGFSNAADLLMSGRIITGKEAAELGLVSKAVPKEELMPTARAIAAEYVHAAPVSVAITKKLMWEGVNSGVQDMARREGPLFAWLGNQKDAKEGIQSFLEKRDPEWNLSAAKDLPETL